MSYVLGIDLGTTYSAAALDSEGRTEIFQLGSRAAVIPSVVVLRSDGEVLTGEAAERRAQTEPARTAREFKRRLGDPTPLILGGTPYGAESVMSLQLKAVVDQIVEQRGQRPALICITHPASYGPYKLDLLGQSVRQADVSPVVFLSEPQAAALHYASQERVEPASIVAVYDFGGGTFDAAILRKTDDGFELLGEPEGMERLGGIDFDEAIFQHVSRALNGKLQELDYDSPAAQAGVSRLRDECRLAKEALSADTEAVIPVLLPNVQTEVRLTRSEFEALISPRIKETIAVLERCVRSANLTMEQVDRILLVGGSSRIPLVGALVREATGLPTAVDTHPKHAIALGAATEARRHVAAGAPVVATAPAPVRASAAPSTQAGGETLPSAPAAIAPVETPVAASNGRSEVTSTIVERTAAPGPAPAAPPPTGGGGRGKWVAIAGAAIVALGAVTGVVLLLGGDDDDPAAAEEDPTETPTTATGTASPSVQAATSPTIAPTATPTLAPNTSRISGITVADGRYEVVFEVAGFTPLIADQHVHFFFDTVAPTQAGVPGSGPWFVYDGGSPFTGYGVTDRPAAASQMCILVANSKHEVFQGTGNCMPLP